MKSVLDLDTWKRKEHFLFFKDFDEPFFGICTDINCSQAYTKCKQNDRSFFLYYLHKSLTAANTIKPFRYRIEDNQVWVYDKVHATPTILRDDDTFGFSYMDYHTDFETFATQAQEEIERTKNRSDLVPAEPNTNVIHFSSLPWIDFTSFSHARTFDTVDSCPKISFGKMKEENDQKKMPLSIHVHHALMDGFHVGQFVDLLQQLLNE